MNTRLLPWSVAAGLVVAIGTAPAFATEPIERVSRSAEGFAGEHASDELRDPASFEIVRRRPDEVVTKPRASSGDYGKGFNDVRAYGDSWIYEATTDIFADRDGDGYYRYLRVRFDADTIYNYSYVYAEIYLSADGNAWEHLYSTQDFAIWGSDPDDDYEVETELVSGYSTGTYDVLIELYDADTGELVDEFGPNESPDFSLLPLEDSSRDGVIVYDDYHDGGGGAVSWLGLAGLLAAAAARRRRLL